MTYDVPSGETREVPEGRENAGDPVTISGQLNIAGQLNVTPATKESASGAGGATGTATATPRLYASAAGAGGATGAATADQLVPLVRESDRSVAWHETEDRTLNADSDQ